jgi:hypothetical protein
MRATLALGSLLGSAPFDSGPWIPDRILGRYSSRGNDYNAWDTETRKTASMQTLILTYPTESDDEAPLEGKFLQLRWAGRAYLLFASADEHRYHNQILGRFLSEQGIPHHWEGAANLVVDHPELSINGGGRFRLDLPTKQLRVWDTSSVYGCFDASALSVQLAAADPRWQELALSIA